MKTITKKHSFAIISILFVFTIISFIYMNHRIDSVNDRLTCLNKNFQRLVIKDSTLVKEIKFQQFKEDSYIRQLDRDTNLILWFVALVFGLFGLISYSSFNKRISDIEENFQKTYDGHINKANSLTEELFELKADLNSESYTINTEKAQNFFKEKKYDLYIFYELLASSKLTHSYLHNKDKHQSLAESELKAIKSNISIIYSRIKDLEKKPEIDKTTFNSFINSLHRINDIEINENISKIYQAVETK